MDLWRTGCLALRAGDMGAENAGTIVPLLTVVCSRVAYLRSNMLPVAESTETTQQVQMYWRA